ncbi:uncharacterized protein BKA55DRAFT_567854 [Fusarium redolens]|uniref:Uncharacterized protein n=1 Tax=Fusarium redolens TaxID=48865 RepID=A0A9P9KA53_FUSRE|nr:uncharacterized protein BKA55DRAFT_567854 [Fusarium redolens]KAH7249761.1 hypothetical protein BKA55DRAFT_567854 [Fusarium redolens]
MILMVFIHYELVTRDKTLRAIRHKEQDVSRVEQREWMKHIDIQLDSTVMKITKNRKEKVLTP